MQLYSRRISPFAARVRVSILAKKLNVHVVDDPDVNAASFARLNPMRRVPVLVLDDGRALAESDTIVEYLEDAYPEIPLRPAAAADRAQVRLISRAAELYVFPAAVPIFGARATGDAEQISGLFGSLDRHLAALNALLQNPDGTWHAFGDTLTTADGALAPFLFYVYFLGKACGREPLADYAHLRRFWTGAQADPILSTVINEIGQAMASRQRATAAA